MSSSISALMAPIADILLGAPNEHLSSKDELRYGSRGSTSVDLSKGTWFDHERGAGGGVFDLIRDHTGLADQDAYRWIEEHGLEIERAKAAPRPNGKSWSRPAGKIVARYEYRAEGGELLFEVVRYAEPKDFRQRRPDPDAPSGWIWSVKGVRQVPYRLPELLEQIKLGHEILIVEGEKDADACWRLGRPATCNAGGAGKWSADLNQFFRDADVCIIGDHDPQTRDPRTGELRFHANGRPILPGQDHAQDVTRHLSGVAARVRVVDLAKYWPDAPPKADVSDWLALGHSRTDLDVLIDLAENFRPEQQQDEQPNPAIKDEAERPRLILSSAEFVSGFVPPDCVLQGVLQRRFLYGFTGKTGSGKTAILLLLAAHVGLCKPIGDRSVEPGRVLYFAGENPDDVRMRWIAMAQQLGFELDEIPVHFIPGVFKLSQMFKRIRAEVERIGPVSLIIVDTSAAFFEGDEENSNVQLGHHARRLRSLISMPGEPCVIAACHPVKNALDDNLIPRGGGPFSPRWTATLSLRLMQAEWRFIGRARFVVRTFRRCTSTFAPSRTSV